MFKQPGRQGDGKAAEVQRMQWDPGEAAGVGVTIQLRDAQLLFVAKLLFALLFPKAPTWMLAYSLIALLSRNLDFKAKWPDDAKFYVASPFDLKAVSMLKDVKLQFITMFSKALTGFAVPLMEISKYRDVNRKYS